MRTESFQILIDGEEVGDLYQDLVGLEVELDVELTGMFRIYLATLMRGDGSWPHVDDERLRPWKPVTIQADFEDGTEELISGYVTHLKPRFDPDPANCIVEVWGMDVGVLMDRREVLKDWPNRKDSDIAAEIFGLYGLAPEVEDTEVIHEEAVSTIIQRETDLQFLARLALRNGYECYVENGTGYFRPPQLDEPPQPVLAAHFGEATTLTRFTVEVDALAPCQVAMFQIDRAEKEVLSARAESTTLPVLGAEGAADLLPAGMEPAQRFVAMSAAVSQAEMSQLCQGLLHGSEWFVEAEGEVLANRYGHVLRPRRTVTVKGVGESHSGVYYVRRVSHVFTADGYVQRFQAVRNGLMPTGAEEFSAEGGLLAAVGL